MSLKVPIISSKVGGISDIVKHKKTGFLIKNKNYEEYAKYMGIYLKNKNLAIIHGENAKKEHQNKFTEIIFEKKLIKILNKII